MKESWDTLERWYDVAEPVTAIQHGDGVSRGALYDDLNTPQAIAELHKASPEELAGGLSLLGFNPMSERLASKKAVDTVEIARRHRSAQRGAEGEGLQGIRPHPRRASGARHPAEGRPRRHHLGSEAVRAARGGGRRNADRRACRPRPRPGAPLEERGSGATCSAMISPASSTPRSPMSSGASCRSIGGCWPMCRRSRSPCTACCGARCSWWRCRLARGRAAASRWRCSATRACSAR